MPFPSLTDEQLDEVTRLILMNHYKRNYRTWHYWDRSDDTWVPVPALAVKRLVRDQVDLVSKLPGRPAFHYREIYGSIASLANKKDRSRWFADRYPGLAFPVVPVDL